MMLLLVFVSAVVVVAAGGNNDKPPRLRTVEGEVRAALQAAKRRRLAKGLFSLSSTPGTTRHSHRLTSRQASMVKNCLPRPRDANERERRVSSFEARFSDVEAESLLTSDPEQEPGRRQKQHERPRAGKAKRAKRARKAGIRSLTRFFSLFSLCSSLALSLCLSVLLCSWLHCFVCTSSD